MPQRTFFSRLKPRAVSLALALTAFICSPAFAGEKAIMVLDASGSMWGRLDGTPKIEIARNTLNAVLGKIPESTELGLVAYGHRRRGDCADIELLVEPASSSRQAIARAVKKLQPKGKTPLSASVKKAAESLRYTQERATVILITDGLETCNADPCALGRELENTGVDFTAHVVGFDLSREESEKVACLARETGGQYLDAANADQLGAALEKTVAETPKEDGPAPAETHEASLTAPETARSSTLVEVAWDGPGNNLDAVGIKQPGRKGKSVVLTRVSANDEERIVELKAPEKPGDYEIYYWDYTNKSYLAKRALKIIAGE